jgi:hypothetical protein
MKHLPLALLQFAAVSFALLRGLGELAMLQRWRLRGWLQPHR